MGIQRQAHGIRLQPESDDKGSPCPMDVQSFAELAPVLATGDLLEKS